MVRGLAKLGVTTVADLLTYLPRRYEDRREITAIANVIGGRSATISARVTDVRVEKKRWVCSDDCINCGETGTEYMIHCKVWCGSDNAKLREVDTALENLLTVATKFESAA
ncbi:hypothetical protein EBU58_11245, partial [bacterium]|nr:hypothetical protein [bacterium]